MKKLNFLLAIVAVFLGFTISLNAGATCASSTSITVGSVNTDTLSGAGKWYSFTATDSLLRVNLKNLSDTSYGHIHAIEVYTGSCSSLVLLDAVYARPDSATNHFGYCDSLYLYLDSILIGHTYYIHVLRESTGSAYCRYCQNASNSTTLSYRFSVVSAAASNSINFNPNYTYMNPGCPTLYIGNLTVQKNGQYRVTGSQAGAFNVFTWTTDWVDLVESSTNTNMTAIDASGNSQTLSLNKNNTYDFIVNTRIDCNAIGGQSATLTFNLQKKGIFNNWTTVATATYTIYILHTATATTYTVCPGGTVTLSAVSPVGAPYSWSPSGSLSCSTCSSPVASPTVTTTYTLTAHNPNTCCPTINDQITITVDAPLPSFTVNNETCVGSAFSFTNTSTNCTSYSWNFGDGAGSSTATNPTYTYSNPGQYTVTLTASNATCSAQYQMLVSVTPSTEGYNATCCTASETYKYTSLHLRTNADVTNFLNSFAINPTTSWFSCTIKDTLFIENNLSVTLTLKELGFGPWGKIIVEKGSQLTLDHCYLDYAGKLHDSPPPCAMMWQGIEVRGDVTKTQTAINPTTGTIYQGKITIKNSTIIRDAHNAVVAGKWLGHSYDPNGGGGIIIASTNAKFINCGYVLRFMPYPFVNNSRITGCSFNCGMLDDPGYLNTNSYTYPNPPNAQYAIANANRRTYAFVQCIQNKFIVFDDNTFDGAEYGVLGVNSSIRLNDANSNGSGNAFLHITNGESHANIFSSPFFSNKIENNQYTYCTAPITTWSGMGDHINYNLIPVAGSFVGIGNTSSQSLWVNDNNITGAFIGVSASNTGTMGGEIGYITLGNTFTKCTDGTYLGGNNSYLQVHCNKYDNSIAANYNVNWLNFGPLANQGYLPILTDKDPAGNNFLQYTPLRNQINSTVLFNYYAHSADQFGNPVTVIPTPTGSLTPGNIVNTGIQKTNTSCDPAPPCQNCGNLIVQANKEVERLETEKVRIVERLDGGKTATLLSEMSTLDSTNIKDTLLKYSPLSDEVLVAFITHPDVPTAIFIQVVGANAPVSNGVWEILYGYVSGMDSTDQAKILAAQADTSNRTLALVDGELQSMIGYRQMLYNQRVDYYVSKTENDSTGAYRDSVYYTLADERTVAAQQAIAASYLAEGRYTEAAAAIDALSGGKGADEMEYNFLKLILNVYSSGRDMFDMTAGEISQVREIAESETACLARTNARVLLFAVFGEPLELEIEGSEGRLASQPPVASEPVLPLVSKCRPNPATDHVFIDCTVSDNAPGILRIFDLNGKQVLVVQLAPGQQTVSIDTQNWQSGVYMYSLESAGTRSQVEKMVIVHQQ